MLFGTIFTIAGIGSIMVSFLLSILLINKKIILKNEDIHIIALFYLLPFCMFSINIIRFFINGIPFVEFYPSTIGRIYNLVVYFVILLYFLDLKNKGMCISTKQIIGFYYTGCCILLFFGFWQLFNVLFNIPYPNFKTRSAINSINSDLLPTFMKLRITSIAEEPSYLVSRLMDASIIGFFFLKKKIMSLIYIILLFFTLSTSGYVNFISILFFTFFLAKTSKKKIFIFAVSFLLVCVLSQKIQPVFIAVLERLRPDRFRIGGRTQDAILPVVYMLSEASLFNLLFGFGPKGMGYIRQFLVYRLGGIQGQTMETVTTHVIFVDFFVDYGLVGLLFLILLFYFLFKLANRTYMLTRNRISQVLCANLFITSLYTADYAMPRFSIILLFILLLYKDAMRLLHENYC
jgi:hypothetical protein